MESEERLLFQPFILNLGIKLINGIFLNETHFFSCYSKSDFSLDIYIFELKIDFSIKFHYSINLIHSSDFIEGSVSVAEF
jgi:hypothetical protein